MGRVADRITPARVFEHVSCDVVAECWDGVVRVKAGGLQDMSLYNALWMALENEPAISEQIDIEESGPGDALGIGSVAKLWSFFTTEQRIWLNEIAEAQP